MGLTVLCLTAVAAMPYRTALCYRMLHWLARPDLPPAVLHLTAMVLCHGLG
jgi:hypothetical protein